MTMKANLLRRACASNPRELGRLRPGPTGLGAGRLLPLALLAGLAALTACDPVRQAASPGGQLYVNTDPAEAAIVCDNRSAPTPSPTTLMGLAAGEHLVVARKAGYTEARATALIQAGERATLDLKLEPLRGLLLIHSKPSGAEVEVEKTNYGKTPLLIPDFPLGPCRLTLRAQNCLPKTVEVNLSDRTPKLLEINLQSDSAKLTFESEPAGAQVTIDGAAIGRTPCEAGRLASGKHRLEINLPGYAPYQEELTVQPGEERTFPVKLTALPGRISVVSLPPKARLYLNDQYKAETPFATNAIPAGQYSVRVELAGYLPQTRACTVSAGEETVLEFKLVRNCGTLLLSTEPPGVTVFLDGEKRGLTSALGQEPISSQLTIDMIPQGAHKLQLTKPGYYDLNTPLNMAPNQTIILHQKLGLRPVRFVPTIIVRTGTDAEHTFRGIIRETFDNGDIKLEIQPGIFKTFKKSEILSSEPIKNP